MLKLTLLLLILTFIQLVHELGNAPFVAMLLQSWEGIVKTKVIFLGCCSLELHHVHFALVSDVDIKSNNSNEDNSYVFLPTHPTHLTLLV